MNNYVEKSIKFSVVIATYNSEKTLRQTLNSLRHQSYRNIEVIVIDGLSKDNTLKIIKEYNDVITKFISEKDTGIYNAFNKGIDLATGDFICFIGSDDCYCNYDVFNTINRVIGNKDIDILSAPVIGVDEENHSEYILKNTRKKVKILSGCMLPHQGLIVKLSIMKKYLFDESYKILGDYKFLLSYIVDGGEISYIDIPIVYFSTGGISGYKEIGSPEWCLHLSEQCRIINEFHLNKYTYKQLNSFLPNQGFKLLRIKIRKFLKIENIYQKIRNKNHAHKCNLKICRWCNRYIE